MGIAEKIKNFIAGKGYKEDEQVETERLEAMERDLGPPPEPPKEEIIGTDDTLEEEQAIAKQEELAEQQMQKQKDRLSRVPDRQEIEQAIDPVRRTQTDQTVYVAGQSGSVAGGLNADLRSKYDKMLQGKLTDDRLKEDILIHRDKILRYRGIVEVMIFTREHGKTAMVKITNSLPDDEAVISQLILGMNGKIGVILETLKSGISGTKMGQITHSEAYVSTNTPVTVTSIHVSHSFA